ncbi:ATP-binding protein [Raineya sp.]|jgi:serine/threonine-protein kinase RsbW
MKYNISIKAEKKNLKKVRTFLENVFAQMQVPEVESNQLILVVDEILANLIIHSAKNDVQKDIDISLTENEGEVTFEIYDYNSPYFDLTQHEDANLQDLKKQKRKGGMGLTLVKNIMDEVEVYYEDNTNIWRLQKRLPFLLLKNKNK